MKTNILVVVLLIATAQAVLCQSSTLKTLSSKTWYGVKILDYGELKETEILGEKNPAQQ